MSAGFTPGPWSVSDLRFQGRLIIRSTDTTVAYAAVGEGEDEDAALIAAAPTMVEALERISRNCPPLTSDDEEDREAIAFAFVGDIARAALAKVRSNIEPNTRGE